MKKTKEDKEPKKIAKDKEVEETKTEQELDKKTTSNKETSNIKNNIKEILPYVIIVLIVVLIRTFLFTPIKVNGTSMVDTLHNGDTMILNKIGVKVNDIKRFQIVVIKTSDSYLIKRVIGLPGETIKYNNGKLYINGKVIKDKYYKNNNTSDFEEVKIPEDSYFVMGDNRSNSIDSRRIGTIEKTDIMGTTRLIIFPLKDIGNAD